MDPHTPPVVSRGMEYGAIPTGARPEDDLTADSAVHHERNHRWARFSRAVGAAAVMMVGLVGAVALNQRGEATDAGIVGGVSGAGVGSDLAALGAQHAGVAQKVQEGQTWGYTQPNILFLLVDDLGWNDIGYNSNDMKGMTPNMDQLAAGGVTLMNYYSQHLCTPARAALMTGKNPIRLGLQHEEVIEPNSPWGVPEHHVFLPKYLRQAGYMNYALGKWHLGHHVEAMLPTHRGFDTFLGFLGDQEYYFSHEYNHVLNNKNYYDLIRSDNSSYHIALDKKGNYSGAMYRDAAADVVATHMENFASSPMFLYYSFQNVHAPLSDDDMPDDDVFSSDELTLLEAISYKPRRKFAKLLVTLDHNVGHIVDTFKDAGIWENTILVMSSDNGACNLGGGYNTPLKGGKHFLFEGGVRVHSFVSSPLLPEKAVGSTYNGLMHVTDWLPTLLFKAGTSPPAHEIDGVNQWDAMMSGGDLASPRTEILHNVDFWRYPADQELEEMANPRAAIRVGDLKLIIHHWHMPEYTCPMDTEDDGVDGSTDCAESPGDVLDNFLYNITADPTESVNLIDDLPDLAETMRSRIYEIYNLTAVDPVWVTPDYDAFLVWDSQGGIVPWHVSVLQEDADGDVDSPAELPDDDAQV